VISIFKERDKSNDFPLVKQNTKVDTVSKDTEKVFDNISLDSNSQGCLKLEQLHDEEIL